VASIVATISEDDYLKRHPPLFKLNKINNDDTYFLGYVIKNEILTRLDQDPTNAVIISDETKNGRHY
jgi:hypothetical protein